ncbi:MULTISPECIES: efflux RND transporter periplasmic adaptor subunit [unclassified Sinorhizobium]|uniref:efflux RND transporter periplasmic adaptor subunit n=1 Tax=unclassified Sinorhizobium TaxID=2613772 RepID=UPI0035239F3A
MKSILVTAMLVGVAALSSCSNEEGGAQNRPRIVEVVVASEQPREKASTITGEIRARVQTDLSFRVSGKIIERLVDVGTPVKAGQLLARIDAEQQKAELDVATANLQSAEAQETQARLAFDRQQNLFRTQVTTRAAFDQAQEALLTARGATKSAQAQLETAQDALSYTELRADADGIITSRSAEVGQVAQAAQAIFSLAHDGSRDAVFDVFESLFLEREIEDVVDVSLLSDPSHKLNARIREISPTIDSSMGTIRVKVGLNGDTSMPLGAPVAGYFHLKRHDVIQLPWSAMASKSGQPAVWVVNPGSSAISMRPIEVGEYETGSFTVKSGVSPGDIVVSEGTKFLRSGEVVSYNSGAAK